MRPLTELGLSPATLATLHHAGIDTTRELLDHSCRELTWHSEISGQQLYEIIRQRMSGSSWNFESGLRDLTVRQ